MQAANEEEKFDVQGLFQAGGFLSPISRSAYISGPLINQVRVTGSPEAILSSA